MLFQHEQSKAIRLEHNLFLCSEQKYKNNFKNCESQKNQKKKKNTILIYVYVMFYFELPWFLNLYPVHTAKMLDLSLEIMLSPTKWRTKHLYNSKSFFFMPQQVQYFYSSIFLEAKFINTFKMFWQPVNFEICSVKFKLVIEF